MKLARPRGRARTTRVIAGLKLDPSGNTVKGSTAMPVDLYTVPLGYTFALHRATFAADGYSFATPFTNTAGFLELRRAGFTQDGVGLGSPGLPCIWVEDAGEGVEYTDGETVDLLITGGPPATSVQVCLQGDLRRLD